MDKIKEFFNKKWVKITGWVMALTGSAILIIGGTPLTDISDGIKLVFGILSAIGLLIVFLTGKFKKTN